MAEHVLNLVPKHTHTYHQYVTPKELESELANAGCILRNVSGMVFHPLAGDWKLVDTIGPNLTSDPMARLIRQSALQANYISCAVKKP